MSIIVQKFGGSSVATSDHISAVAARILRARDNGHDVVVTVSAMGDTTSEFLERAVTVSEAPAPRELDALLSTGERISAALLSMALAQHGAPAVSLDGRQAGVRTDDRHCNAAIESVDATRIRAELDAGRIPVVTGYQGRDASGEITTLGFGGSDTTAVALAAALGAERCDICTDVDGVYSADPRTVPDAYRLEQLSYTEMVELARHGASVLNPRSVEHARRHDVRLRVCSSFEPDDPGTLVSAAAPDAVPRAVGIASHDGVVPVSIDDDAGRTDRIGDRILRWLGEPDVLLDRFADDRRRRQILIPVANIADRAALAEWVAGEFGPGVSVDTERGSVSAVGLGVGSDAELAQESRRDTERAGIPLYDHYTDEHAVTCVLFARAVPLAVELFHRRLAPAAEAA